MGWENAAVKEQPDGTSTSPISPRFGAGAVAMHVIRAKGFKGRPFRVIAVFAFGKGGSSLRDGVPSRREQCAQLGGGPVQGPGCAADIAVV